MLRSNGVHWLAPASMFGALILGVLFAVGHHIFYSSLSGTSASGDGYRVLGDNITLQQANIAGGTAFAFLVKAMLVYAAAVAFVQLFWKVAISNRATTTLGKLDSLAHAPDNLLVLQNLGLWWRHGLLLLMATSTWYLSTRLRID